MMWPAAMLEELNCGRERLRAEMARADRSIRSEQCTSLELRRGVLSLRDALCVYTDLEDELMPLLLRVLGEWGDDQVGSMSVEHAIRRVGLADALRDLAALGDAETPGDVYGMTDALVHLRTSVLAALDAEDSLLRDARDRTDDMNNDGSAG